MSEDTKKTAIEYQEIEPVEAISAISQDRRVTSYVYDKTNLVRYTVVAEAPEVPDMDTNFDCKLAVLVHMGLRQAIYGCDFKSILEIAVKENWTTDKTMASLQEVVEGISLKPREKVERTKVAAETKAKAKELDSLNAMAQAAGFTNVAEFVASLQKKSKK